MSEASPGEIDPAWWEAALSSSAEYGKFEKPELISSAFKCAVKGENLESLEQGVLASLRLATSAMLAPDNWLEPFTPIMQIGDRRSPLPIDLDPGQLDLLARIAPLIEQSSLQARVADVA